MRLISIEDFRDIHLKAVQRGLNFLVSKISFDKNSRTKSSFNESHIPTANWWDIPAIHARWNFLTTGSPEESYEEYLSTKILTESSPLRMLSLGSGACSHELRLAELNPHWEVLCVDFSDLPLKKAERIAKEKKLTNIRFVVADIYHYPLPDHSFDIVFFHQSLHHFAKMETFIAEGVVRKLRDNGKLVINEYVGPNRLQFPRKQLEAISQCIQLVDEKYRTMYKSKLVKNKYYGSGLLRMKISDPSECIDSSNILPAIYKHLDPIYERPYGGNLLMCALKDIAHHFVVLDAEKANNLQRMMDFEDRYLLENNSDFVFGVYQKKQVTAGSSKK